MAGDFAEGRPVRKESPLGVRKPTPHRSLSTRTAPLRKNRSSEQIFESSAFCRTSQVEPGRIRPTAGRIRPGEFPDQQASTDGHQRRILAMRRGLGGPSVVRPEPSQMSGAWFPDPSHG